MLSESVLSDLQGCFLVYLFLFVRLVLFVFSVSVDFRYSKGVIFLILLGAFSWVFFYRAFLLSGSDLSSTPYVGLLCLLTKCILLIPA